MAESTIAPPAPQEPPQASTTSWLRRPEVRGVFWIWLVLTVLGLSLCWVPAWLMGPSASEQMNDIKQTMTWFTAASAPVAALVWAVMLYSLMRWRYRGEGPPPDDAPPFRSNATTVVTWAVTSALLTLFVFIWGLLKIASVPASGGLSALPADGGMVPLEVNVIGNQWVWNFGYPENGGVESEVLVLPVDRPVTFEVTSNDVIHSFWIVEMGIKVDANPGAITQTVVTPNALGTYNIRCAELCGILHGAMGTTVKVVTPEEFDAWVQAKQESQPPAMATEESEGDA